METTKICPGCQKPLEAGAPDGLCPQCLLKAGLGSGVDIGPDSHGASGRTAFVAPTPEEVARLFPQLEILGFLGQGGMGAVYKARQKELDRVVALKILPPGVGKEPAFAERFTREARALAKLNHPGIVTLYEFGKADGLFFFLMEFVDGMSLRRLLEVGRIAAREALAIVPQMCDALQYAHDQGIVHRDIKPENVLLDRRGRVKVADFGLAKIVGAGAEAAGAGSGGRPGLTEAGRVMGTPQYMAPEQREHPTEVDHRADIYSLGVVFYQMLTGELPGKPIQLPSRKVQVDVRLDEVVLHALEKEPERRYQQASQVKTAVETIAATSEPVRHPMGEVEDARQPVKGPAILAPKPTMPAAIWLPVILLALLIPLKLLATPWMGLRAPFDAIVFGVLLTGLVLRAKWAYLLVPARCAFNLFHIAAHGVTVTGPLSGLPREAFLLVALAFDALVAVPVLLSPRWFFPSECPERSRRHWLWSTAGATVLTALAGLLWGPNSAFQGPGAVSLGPVPGASLTSAQIEAYLAQNKRNAESLLAAYRMSANLAYLKEATGKFSADRDVEYAVIAANAFPAEQRQWIDAYKASSPDNALAWYFSALDYFRAGQTNLAVQELAEATRKPAFRAELAPMLQAVEELNLSAGRRARDAKMVALAACALGPHLAPMRELAHAMEAAARQDREQGDSAAAESLAGMGLVLGNHLAAGGGSQTVLNQLMGIAIEKMFVRQLDPNSRDPLGRRVGEVSAAIAQHEQTLKSYARMIGRLQAKLSAAEAATYLERVKLYGEEAALSGLKAKYEGP